MVADWDQTNWETTKASEGFTLQMVHLYTKQAGHSMPTGAVTCQLSIMWLLAMPTQRASRFTDCAIGPVYLQSGETNSPVQKRVFFSKLSMGGLQIYQVSVVLLLFAKEKEKLSNPF